jgi:glycosyltransferase EpsJ
MDDYEIILVNDGSPDNCPAICVGYEVRYPDRVRVVHKKNGGPAIARNIGIRLAKGDYLMFVDSDDFLCADGVASLYSKAVEFNADIVHSSCIKYDERKNTKEKVDSAFETDRVFTHEDMEKELCSASSKGKVTFMWRNLYKREFIKKESLRLDEELMMVEDPPFNVHAFSKAKRFYAVDIPVYCYRLRDDSLQRQKYVPDYDKWICLQWSLKMKYYAESCTQLQLFSEDLSEYTIKTIFPVLLKNVYRNKPDESYSVLKRLGQSEMMRRSFADYDINKFKSKSLDWLMTKFVMKKHYLTAHLMCKYILYK